MPGFRDVVERHHVSSVPALRALIRHAMNAPATLFSVNRFYNDLRSQGVACGKNTLHELLAYLEDAYLLFTVPIHTHSERARQVNPRKLYAIDQGLVQACRRPGADDRGHLLENTVFIELRRRGHSAAYYRTKADREVDFLVTPRTGRPYFVQVCAELLDPKTREREAQALAEAMAETGIREAVIVTNADPTNQSLEGCQARVVPAWKWLLADAPEPETP